MHVSAFPTIDFKGSKITTPESDIGRSVEGVAVVQIEGVYVIVPADDLPQQYLWTVKREIQLAEYRALQLGNSSPTSGNNCVPFGPKLTLLKFTAFWEIRLRTGHY